MEPNNSKCNIKSKKNDINDNSINTTNNREEYNSEFEFEKASIEKSEIEAAESTYSLEVEESKKLSYCPNCKQDVIFTKTESYDHSKLFILFASFSVLWIIIARLILFFNNIVKKKKLPDEIKSELNKDKICYLNLTFPKTVTVSCKYCKHEFYSNYNKSDLINISIVFFGFIIIMTFIIIYFIRN